MSQSQSPLEGHRTSIVNAKIAGHTNSEILRDLTDLGLVTSERSLRRALRRWGIDTPAATTSAPARPGVSIQGDQGEVISTPSPDMTDYEALLRERKLDPEEWEVRTLKVNEWDALSSDGEKLTMRQLCASIQRKRPMQIVLPASATSTYRAPRLPEPRGKGEPELHVFLGDQQAPYHNEFLHEKVCRFFERIQPHGATLMGDGMDLPDISRHPENPEWHVSAQRCVDACYGLYADYRRAFEYMRMRKLLGNHDDRIRTRLLSLMTNLYGLRPAAVPGAEPVPALWDIRTLLHLDDLNIELIVPNGAYTHAQVNVCENLAARHGWIAKKGSGASALSTLEQLGYSIVVGHTHRQALVHKTTHDINGHIRTLVAAETGCLCRIEGGLGYATAPDWQNGFATAAVWPDGKFKIDLAVYVDNTLYWRDERF